MVFFVIVVVFKYRDFNNCCMCQDVHGKLHWDWSTSYEGDT